jgi:hypothetical protein
MAEYRQPVKRQTTINVTDKGIKQPIVKNSIGTPDPFNPTSHYNQSASRRSLSLRSISYKTLFSRAIERISNSVAAMPWTIAPMDDEKADKPALEKARELTKALSRPNQDEHDLYTTFVKALIRDILVIGLAVVERQPGTEGFQPFWLWGTPPEKIYLDSGWDASREGLHPRFWYCINTNANSYEYLNEDNWIPILNKNMFLIQNRVATNELFPPSPVAAAYERLNTWLSLDSYQARTVSNPVRDYMVALEEATSEEEIDRFREYWRVHVVGSGEIPVVGGKVNVIKFGAKNDEELFVKFSDYLAGLIALEFGLSKRDYGIDPHDNRSTMGPAADLSFQDAILPIANCVIDNLNAKVIDFYAPGFILSLTDTEPRKESEEAQTATILYTGNLVTKDEGRRRVGEKPLLQGGNKFMDGSTDSVDAEVNLEETVDPEPEKQQAVLVEPVKPVKPVKPEKAVKQKKVKKNKSKQSQSEIQGVQLSLFDR